MRQSRGDTKEEDVICHHSAHCRQILSIKTPLSSPSNSRIIWHVAAVACVCVKHMRLFTFVWRQIALFPIWRPDLYGRDMMSICWGGGGGGASGSIRPLEVTDTYKSSHATVMRRILCRTLRRRWQQSRTPVWVPQEPGQDICPNFKINTPGADPGFLKRGGVHLRSTSKKKGGAKRGSNFGPNVKKPTSKGGGGPPGPPPPDPLLHSPVVEQIKCPQHAWFS